MSFSSYSDFGRWSGIPADAYADRQENVQPFLDSAYDEMLGYFRSANPPITLPIPKASVTLMLKKVECWIAAWSMVCDIGFDPTSKSDEIYRTQYEDAVAWLTKVAAGKITPVAPPPTDPNSPSDLDDSSAAIVSDTPRNWGALVS